MRLAFKFKTEEDIAMFQDAARRDEAGTSALTLDEQMQNLQARLQAEQQAGQGRVGDIRNVMTRLACYLQMIIDVHNADVEAEKTAKKKAAKAAAAAAAAGAGDKAAAEGEGEGEGGKKGGRKEGKDKPRAMSVVDEMSEMLEDEVKVPSRVVDAVERRNPLHSSAAWGDAGLRSKSSVYLLPMLHDVARVKEIDAKRFGKKSPADATAADEGGSGGKPGSNGGAGAAGEGEDGKKVSKYMQKQQEREARRRAEKAELAREEERERARRRQREAPMTADEAEVERLLNAEKHADWEALSGAERDRLTRESGRWRDDSR